MFPHAPGTLGCLRSAWQTSTRSCTASVRSISVGREVLTNLIQFFFTDKKFCQNANSAKCIGIFSYLQSLNIIRRNSFAFFTFIQNV